MPTKMNSMGHNFQAMRQLKSMTSSEAKREITPTKRMMMPRNKFLLFMIICF